VTNVSFYHFRSCNCGFGFGHDFLKILVEVGEWIKYTGKHIWLKTDFPFKSYDKNLFFFAKNGQLLSLLGTREKNFSFPIRAVNFCKTFCTCSLRSVGQDLTVKIAKKILKIHLGFLSYKWQFWMFFEKKGLCPLGVRPWICVFFIFF
jgi:hypothetical protein